MKAVVLRDFGGIDNFFLDEKIALPEIGNNEVLVKINASAFNPIDYQMRQGRTERKKMRSFILGREFSGKIIKVGKQVKNFKEGDAVLAAAGSMGSNGSYATYISVPEMIVAHMPANLSYEEAAALPVAGLTAIQCLNRLPLALGDSIFVSGAAGGVGLMLVKLLLSKGYVNITVTAGNEESKNKLIQLGISEDQVIDYKLPKLKRRILETSHNKYFKCCIDLVGRRMSRLCASLLDTNGYYLDITALTTKAAREILFDKGAVVLNISNYSYMLAGNLSYYGKQLESLLSLLEKHLIAPPPINIVGNLSVETVRTAHMILEQNLSKGNKLVMLHV